VDPDLEFHPAAEAELLEAEEWYAKRNVAAARAFVREVIATLERILAAPRRWPQFEHNTRRIILRRFPYSVIYRTKADVVEVVAVAHHSRRPGYWKGR
jgi:toxin ParE1/3/4